MRCCWRPVVQLGRLSTPHRQYSSKIPLRPKLPPQLAALHAFLAPTNLASPEPLTYTPKALYRLYKAVKVPRRGVHPLNGYELNELLMLFGTLSIPPPRPKCIYTHTFVSHIPEASFRMYWPLVLELAEQIRVRPKRKPRTGAHHYWVMRAHLARMSAAKQVQQGSLGVCLHTVCANYNRSGSCR
jgi:hypothetical protein